jgi:hypothetical protein
LSNVRLSDGIAKRLSRIISTDVGDIDRKRPRVYDLERRNLAGALRSLARSVIA